MTTNPEFLAFIGMLDSDAPSSPDHFVRVDAGIRDDTLTLGDFQVCWRK